MKRTLLVVLLAAVVALALGCGDGPTAAKDAAQDNGADPRAGDGPKSCERVDIEPLTPPDLTGGPSEVLLDENGSFVVNGEPFWPFGFYRMPEEDEYDDLTEAGFNTILHGGDCCSGGNLAGRIADLETLADHGLMGVSRAIKPTNLIYSETEQTIQDWLDARHAVGNTLFWYMYDEPGLHSVDKQEAEDYDEILTTLDPDHPHALVQAALEDFTEYMPYTDFMMMDPYPAGSFPLSYLMEMYREAVAASNGEKRVMGVGQAFDWFVHYGVAPEGHEWRPNARELRNMTYQYMVLGANGILYWNLNDITDEPERWQDMLAIAAEVTELMPLLVTPNVEMDLGADYLHVPWALKEMDGVHYLMMVSVWWDDMEVEFDLSPLGGDLCVLDYFTEETFDVAEDGTLKFTLPMEDALVLQIVSE